VRTGKMRTHATRKRKKTMDFAALWDEGGNANPLRRGSDCYMLAQEAGESGGDDKAKRVQRKTHRTRQKKRNKMAAGKQAGILDWRSNAIRSKVLHIRRS